jgi:hypothetical protein
MSQLSDGEKLLLKNYIRLLFNIREKVNTFKNKVDAPEPTNDAFLEYLHILQQQVSYNKDQNNEDINTRALDETYVEAIIGQRVYSIDKSTLQKESKATKSMSKIMEDMLNKMSTMDDDHKKHNYVLSKINTLPNNELNTLQEVLIKKREYIENKSNMSDKEKDSTIYNIDGILATIEEIIEEIRKQDNIDNEEAEEY